VFVFYSVVVFFSPQKKKIRKKIGCLWISGRSIRVVDQVRTGKLPSCLRRGGRRPGWWESDRLLILWSFFSPQNGKTKKNRMNHEKHETHETTKNHRQLKFGIWNLEFSKFYPCRTARRSSISSPPLMTR